MSGDEIDGYYTIQYLYMTSTRSKNTSGNYELEKLKYHKSSIYLMYENKEFPPITYYPGNGLLTGRVRSDQLCNNFIDVETELHGIGSCNLENPRERIYPQPKTLGTVHLSYKPPLIIPEPLTVYKNERPTLS